MHTLHKKIEKFTKKNPECSVEIPFFPVKRKILPDEINEAHAIEKKK